MNNKIGPNPSAPPEDHTNEREAVRAALASEGAKQATTRKEYPHYYKRVPQGVTHLDVYAVLRMWEVSDPAVAHALKKLLCAGTRGSKARAQDLKEAVVSINRAIAMDEEFAEGED